MEGRPMWTWMLPNVRLLLLLLLCLCYSRLTACSLVVWLNWEGAMLGFGCYFYRTIALGHYSFTLSYCAHLDVNLLVSTKMSILCNAILVCKGKPWGQLIWVASVAHWDLNGQWSQGAFHPEYSDTSASFQPTADASHNYLHPAHSNKNQTNCCLTVHC